MPEVREDGYYCKKCGVKLFQRKDDNLETVKTRLETYDKQTLPLVNYYKKQGILHSFDGNKLKYNIIAEDIAKANK
jgi:adenylate kinase